MSDFLLKPRGKASLARSSVLSESQRAFLHGLASVFLFFHPADIRYPFGSDEEALQFDWERIGDDFRSAIIEFDEQNAPS